LGKEIQIDSHVSMWTALLGEDQDHIQLWIINLLHLRQYCRRCREGITWD